METTTPFDLNRAIQHWREKLMQSATFRGENLNELESHLRDSIAALQTRGLTAEEALLIGTRRLGQPGEIGSEFGKVNPLLLWRDRSLWMLTGMLVLIIGWDLSRMTALAIIYFGSLTGATGLSLGWFGVVAKLLTLGLIAVGFWLISLGRVPRWSTSSSWLQRYPVGSSAILLGGILLLKVVASAFELLLIRNLGTHGLGQTYAVTLWFNALVPALAVVAMVLLLAWLLSGRTKRFGSFHVAGWILIPLAATSFLPLTVQAQTDAKPGISSPKIVSDKVDNATLDDAMKLWTAGQKDAAMTKFLAVNFSKRPLFPSGSVLNYTEAQFIALPQAAREKLSKQMLDDIHLVKEICAHIKTASKAAQEAGDQTKSDRCMSKLQQCGDALDQPDSLALLKLVGKALKKMSAGTAGTGK